MESVREKVMGYSGNRKNLVHTKKLASYNKPIAKTLGHYTTPNKNLGNYNGKC